MMNGLQRGKNEFSEEKLLSGEYKVEAIDGNHSLHAMRNPRDDERFAEREVVIYSKMSEEQHLLLGITEIKKIP